MQSASCPIFTHFVYINKPSKRVENFVKNSGYKISRKPFPCETRCSIRTDRQTDIIKPKVVTYGYFVNATKKRNVLLSFTIHSARTARIHVKCKYSTLYKVQPIAAENTDKGAQTYSTIFTDSA